MLAYFRIYKTEIISASVTKPLFLKKPGSERGVFILANERVWFLMGRAGLPECNITTEKYLHGNISYEQRRVGLAGVGAGLDRLRYGVWGLRIGPTGRLNGVG